MPNTRPIPKVDLTPYLEQDSIKAKVKGSDVHVEFGDDRCRTVVLNEKEMLSTLVHLTHHAKKAWGQEFMDKLAHQMEVM